MVAIAMPKNIIDAGDSRAIVEAAQEALYRSKALISAAIVLAMHNDGMDFMTAANSFNYDRLICQLEAAEMLIDSYQEQFYEVERQVNRASHMPTGLSPAV